MEKLYYMDIDIVIGKSNKRIEFVRGDTDTNFIYFTLTNGDIVEPLEGKVVKVTVKRPDGQAIICNTTVDLVENVIKYEVGTSEIDVPGMCQATLQIYEGEKRLTTQQFVFYVRDDLSSTGVNSSTDYPAFTQLLNEYALIDEKVQKLTADLADILNYKDEINNSLSLVYTFPFNSIPITSNYTGLQASAIANNKLYVTCSNKTSSNATALLMELDKDTLAVLRTAELPLYHANDIAYNPSYNGKSVLLIPHTSTDAVNPNAISIVDIATLTMVEDKILPKYVYNLTYDIEKSQYVGYANGTDINIFDEQFNFVKTITIASSENTPQGNEIYNGLYISVYTAQNSIYFHDSKGKLVKKYGISEGYGELESCISLGNGDFLLCFNYIIANTTHLAFYKVNIIKNSIIEDKSELNGLNSISRTKSTKYIYVNCAYTGNDSDGSQAKPFKRVTDTYSSMPVNSCYVAINMAPGTYDENAVFRYMSGVYIYMQKYIPTGGVDGVVKIKSISGSFVAGEIAVNNMVIYGNSNIILSSTQNCIELRSVSKFRLINSKVLNESNTATARGIRSQGSTISLEGATEITGCYNAIMLDESSNLYTNTTATFSFSNITDKILNTNGSALNVSAAFIQAIGTSYTSTESAWNQLNKGSLPNSTGDVVTVINDYVAKGYKEGRILFSGSATNMPPTYTSVFITFETFVGSSLVNLKAINLNFSATKIYFGQISGTGILWKSATLA